MIFFFIENMRGRWQFLLLDISKDSALLIHKDKNG